MIGNSALVDKCNVMANAKAKRPVAVPQGILQQSQQVRQKQAQKGVMLPTQSLGHSRQNSCGGNYINSTLGTFQDSLNLGPPQPQGRVILEQHASYKSLSKAADQVVPLQMQKLVLKPMTNQAYSCQISARDTLTMSGSGPNCSITSSTETLLKPGIPLQTRGLMSAQTTAEKQKHTQNQLGHSKRNSSDCINGVKPQQLYVNSFKHQNVQSQNGSQNLNQQNHHRRHLSSTSNSSSGGGSSSRSSKYQPQCSRMINPQHKKTTSGYLINVESSETLTNGGRGLPPQPTMMIHPSPLNQQRPIQDANSQHFMRLQKYNKLLKGGVSGSQQMDNNVLAKKVSQFQKQSIASSSSDQLKKGGYVVAHVHPSTIGYSSTQMKSNNTCEMRTQQQQKAQLSLLVKPQTSQGKVHNVKSGAITSPKSNSQQQQYQILKTSAMTSNLLINNQKTSQTTQQQQQHLMTPLIGRKEKPNSQVASLQNQPPTSAISHQGTSLLSMGTGSLNTVTTGSSHNIIIGDVSARNSVRNGEGLVAQMAASQAFQKPGETSRQQNLVNHKSSLSSQQQQSIYTTDSLKNTPSLAISGRHQPHCDLFNHEIKRSQMEDSKQVVASSHLMMALHKKCNSISTTPIAAALGSLGKQAQMMTNYQATGNMLLQNHKRLMRNSEQQQQPDDNGTTHTLILDTLVEETGSFEVPPPSTVRHNMISTTPTGCLSITSQMSLLHSAEDENAHANQVPQITPRCQNNTTKAAPGMKSPFSVPQNNPVSKRPVTQSSSLGCYIPSTLGNSILQVNSNKENHDSNASRMLTVQQENKNHREGNHSIEEKEASEELSYQKLAQAHEAFSHSKQMTQEKKDAKEEIVLGIGRHLIEQKGGGSSGSAAPIDESSPTHQLTLQHLRDFLTYLEDKQIIHCDTLSKDSKEMKTLINDLVKLDFNKFNCPLGNMQTAASSKELIKCPSTKQVESQKKFSRKGSIETQGPHNQEGRIGGTAGLLSPSHRQHNLVNEDGMIYLYSPINVNGNGNIVSTNIQIYQPSQPAHTTSHIRTQTNSLQKQAFQPQPSNNSRVVFSQPVSHMNSQEKQQAENRFDQSNYNGGQVKFQLAGGAGQMLSHQVPQFRPQYSQPREIVDQMIMVAPSCQVKRQQHKRVHSIGHQEQQFCNPTIPGIPPAHTSIEHAKEVHYDAHHPQDYRGHNFGFGVQGHNLQISEIHSHLNYQAEQRSLKVLPQDFYPQSIFEDAPLSHMNYNGIEQHAEYLPHHYHSRKRSMFVQQCSQEFAENQIFIENKPSLYLNAQHQRSQEAMLALPIDQAICKNYRGTVPTQEEDCLDTIVVQSNKPSKPNHRRATTNFIPNGYHLENNDIRTIQPLSDPYFAAGRQAEIQIQEMEEDKQKLIAYIKHFTLQMRPEIPVTSVDYYKFVKLIGKGAFGKVTLGIHKLSGKYVAIKTVDKALMKDDYQKKKVLQEVQILKKVRHGNVIRLLEVFESPKHLLMVMEYAGGGDLLQYVKKRKRLDEFEARRIFKQVVYGVAHCHCRSVLHRDIKLDNILLDNEGDIKICDFGVSRVISKTQRITEQCGTPAYIAPEIISDGGYNGFAADIWSLGVLLYTLICGTVPFKAQSMHELHELIVNGTFWYPQSLKHSLSQECQDLIQRMLIVNPSDRISISEILKHPWIQMFDTILEDQEYQIDGDITLHSFDAQSNPLQDVANDKFVPTSQSSHINTNELLSNVNVDNLYKEGLLAKQRLCYADYCSITQDYATMHLNEDVLATMDKSMGMPKKLVKDHFNRGDLNHATATYQLMVLP